MASFFFQKWNNNRSSFPYPHEGCKSSKFLFLKNFLYLKFNFLQGLVDNRRKNSEKTIIFHNILMNHSSNGGGSLENKTLSEKKNLVLTHWIGTFLQSITWTPCILNIIDWFWRLERGNRKIELFTDFALQAVNQRHQPNINIYI